MVRERIANPLCAGSSPVYASNADIAQLVELLPSKQIVEGSSPFVRSKGENTREKYNGSIP